MLLHPALVPLASIPGEFHAYSWSNLLMVCWPVQSTASSVRLLTNLRAEFAEAHPEGTSLVHISAEASRPDAETSAAWVAMMKQYREQIGCIAVLTLASGFETSLLHSWATEKRRVAAPGTFKMRFYTTVDALSEWLPAEHERRTGVHLDRGRLVMHLGQLVKLTQTDAAETAAG
ncbi:MAG: hypothetical protein OXU20_35175 [Myxococcales bacterium]|nr:hypothetical protein [Myxococcales bacterium]